MINKIISKLERIFYLVTDYGKVIFAPNDATYLLGAPFHSNLGDQAQTYCAKSILRDVNNRKVIDLTAPSLLAFNSALLKIIRKKASHDALIVLHSGYHMTDIYELENRVILLSLQYFGANKVLILPQTINYTTDESREEMKKAIEKHRQVYLMCRDEVSFAFAKDNFDTPNILLYPDIVTSIIGLKVYNSNKDGILLCFRDDVESKYGEKVDEIKKGLSDLTNNIGQEDTTVATRSLVVTFFRDNILNKFWNNMSQYKLVVTDRYHGTIFSVITGTPVIVMSSTDHKLSSGVKWFPQNIFSKYVKYASSIDEAFDLAHKMYQENDLHRVSKYFSEKYWNADNLRKVINEELL